MDLETRCDSRRRPREGLTIPSAIMTRQTDRQTEHHGPQLRTCIDIPVGLPIEGFLGWSGGWEGRHKIHRAAVKGGHAPTTVCPFLTVRLPRRHSGGKHPNQQTKGRKAP